VRLSYFVCYKSSQNYAGIIYTYCGYNSYQSTNIFGICIGQRAKITFLFVVKIFFLIVFSLLIKYFLLIKFFKQKNRVIFYYLLIFLSLSFNSLLTLLNSCNSPIIKFLRSICHKFRIFLIFSSNFLKLNFRL